MRWIDRCDSKRFKICVTNHTGQTILADAYVDGTFAEGIVLKTPTVTEIRGVQVNQTTIRPFTFSTLQVTGAWLIVASIERTMTPAQMMRT